MTTEYSIQKMVSDGTLSTIALGIQYLQRNDIYMRIAGEETPQSGAPSGYTWSFVDNTTIKILPVVPNGIEVVAYRRTDADAMYNVYSQNAQFDESTIDENNQQLLYIAQEYFEQGVPAQLIDSVEYVREDTTNMYYRLKLSDGKYTAEFPIPKGGVAGFAALRRTYADAGLLLMDGSFETGGTLSSATDVLLHNVTAKAYAWTGAFPHVIVPGTNPTAVGSGYVPRTDVVLRDELLAGALRMRDGLFALRDFVHVADFGAVGDGVTPDTLAIQLAIDYVYTLLGGGTVLLGPKTYKLIASGLNEIYDNYGVPVNSNTGCIILRKGVSLIGVPGKTKLSTDDKLATPIYVIAPVGNVVRDLEIDGGWNPGDVGVNHGIFTLGTQGGADITCERVTFSDLYIHNVASYGLALQNGNPKGVAIERIRVDNIGADALDLKARGGLVSLARGNNVSNVWASRYGQRVDGSSAIDVRGIWNLRGITATDFGGDSTKNYVGVRFRTKPTPSDPQQVADKSTITGFTIIPTPGSAASSISGIECGSDDTHVSNGYVEDCTHGIIYFGNANGSAIRGTITDVTSVNARQYGFRSVAGTQGISFKGCVDVGAVTAGFRIEGDNTNADSCTGSLSVSAGALPTFRQSGCRFGASWVVTERQSDTSVSVTAKGTATDIALRLVPKGTGHIGAFGDVRPDVANTRYLGSNSLPFAGGFIQTAFSVTSDERCKTVPKPITDEMLDAWAEVEYVEYQYLDRVAKKGESVARWHVGAIAQRVIEAFERHDLDAFKYGVVCYNVWDEIPAVIDGETGEIIEMGREAGDRFSLVYEEALVLEAKLQRRNYLRLLARIEALESK